MYVCVCVCACVCACLVVVVCRTVHLPHSGTKTNQQQRYANGTNSTDLVVAFIVQSIMGFVFFLAFGWIRDDLIIYRTRLVHPNCAAVRPPKLPVGQPFYKRIFTWIPAVLRIRQSELLATAGLDALMFDKLMSWGILFFGPLVVLGIGVILPVNYFGGIIKNNKDPLNVVDEDFSLEFTRMTMGNIKQGSKLLFVHFFATYVVIAWASYTLYIRCRQYSLLKREYMGSTSTAAQWQGEFEDPLFHNVKVTMARERSKLDMPRSGSASSLPDLTPHTNTEEAKGKVELQPVGGSNFQGFSTPTAKTEVKRRKKGKSDEEAAETPSGSNMRGERSDVHFEPKLKWFGGPEMWLKDVPMTARDLLDPLTVNNSLEAASADAATSDIEMQMTPEVAPAEQGSPSSLTSSRSSSDIGTESSDAPSTTAEEKKDGGSDAVTATIIMAPAATVIGDVIKNVPAVDAGVSVEDSVNFDKDDGSEGTQYKYSAPAHQYAVLLRDVPIPSSIDGSVNGGGFFGLGSANIGGNRRTQLILVPDKSPAPAVDPESGIPDPTNSSVVIATATDDDTTNAAKRPANGTVIAERVQSPEHAVFRKRKDAESAVEEVELVFNSLFPHSFSKVIPVRNHKKTDILLGKWDYHCRELEEARAKRQTTGKEPYFWWNCLGGPRRLSKIEYHSREVQDLETKVIEAQKAAPYTTSYFVVFTSQLSASIASQVKVRSVDSGRQWTTEASPAADDVHWVTLWRSRWEREIRFLIGLPFVAFLVVFPIGAFAGMLSQLNAFLCPSDPSKKSWEWYCDPELGPGAALQGILNVWAPSLLLLLWQNVILPNGFYALAKFECIVVSNSQLDRQIGGWFFIWAFFNFFLQGAFGGAIFQQIDNMIDDPKLIPRLLGQALPAASNHFISFISLYALAIVPFRLLFPSLVKGWGLGILSAMVRRLFCGCFAGTYNRVKDSSGSKKKKISKLMRMRQAWAWAPKSQRYGREIGVLLMIILISIAYSIISPIILPLTVIFFMLMFLVWRYHMLYVYIRSYESGGTLWPFTFNRIMFILFAFLVFMVSILYWKKAWILSTILLFTTSPFLYQFWVYVDERFHKPVEHITLETARQMPTAEIDSIAFTPPALREDIAGWGPEQSKAWAGWTMPKYTL